MKAAANTKMRMNKIKSLRYPLFRFGGPRAPRPSISCPIPLLLIIAKKERSRSWTHWDNYAHEVIAMFNCANSTSMYVSSGHPDCDTKKVLVRNLQLQQIICSPQKYLSYCNLQYCTALVCRSCFNFDPLFQVFYYISNYSFYYISNINKEAFYNLPGEKNFCEFDSWTIIL